MGESFSIYHIATPSKYNLSKTTTKNTKYVLMLKNTHRAEPISRKIVHNYAIITCKIILNTIVRLMFNFCFACLNCPLQALLNV